METETIISETIKMENKNQSQEVVIPEAMHPELHLTVREIKMFDEIRQVMEKHNLPRKFGLYFVHQHFKLKEGEILHEENDKEKRTHVTTVVKKGSMKNSHKTQWEFE